MLDPVSKQPLFKSGAVRITKAPTEDTANGEVKIHVKEQQTQLVKEIEARGGNQPEREEKRERMLEYWLGTTYGSLDTLAEICEHVIPQAEGADFEISTGMRVMQRITQSCIKRLNPVLERYETDTKLGI